jgi:hypothetical protein
MRRRLAAGIVTAVVSIAMTAPAAGLANTGGTPHTTPPMCHMHKNKGKHTGQTKNASKGKRNGASKGNKCGQPSTTTGTTSTTPTSATTPTSGSPGNSGTKGHKGHKGTH